MRRTDREITDPAALEDILRRARVLRLGLYDGRRPYVVPLSYGWSPGCLYVHSAREGRKVEILRQSPQVCFEVDLDHELVRGARACAWGVRYRSVIGYGRASFVEDPAEVRRALDAIMVQHGGSAQETYDERSLQTVLIIRIDVEELTGKQAGYG
ncbi:MAG: pyridoxamine 5'-phosphate oxidase family protein [Chloroflexi bacterium]|nr:pyridoxamine 5'-phosphate oxidase family protein [Chloroflexota bacterium]